MTVTLIATFTARPGHRVVVAELIAGFADHVRADPGTLVFEPFTGVDDDHDFVVYERYVDEAAFRAHLADPAGVPFNAALSEHIVGDGSVLRFLDPVR
ncbi:antibiotic biosynthesis monooxygenase [Agromyces protaetiae]|uniref:Antibiotic biosynthesis monooxygenase n=1 Tax=Agromyces protaetiae TaxID=2509455 RepID=A0A4P6FCG4_9MICO|nr:putative quinol monooxygenase [Agromyces protaetiae]QAY73742.1 antibiotic biosynthesis monooxygenase [Agromyces protaetiae]